MKKDRVEALGVFAKSAGVLVAVSLVAGAMAARLQVLVIAAAVVVGTFVVVSASRRARHSSTGYLAVTAAALVALSYVLYHLIWRSEVAWAGPPPTRNIILASVLVVTSMATFLITSRRWYPRRVRILAGCIAAIALVLIVFTALKTSFNFLGPPPDLFVNEYTAQLVQDEEKAGQFLIHEELALDPESSKRYLPAGRPPRLVRRPRSVTASRRGLMVREVTFALPETDTSGYAVKPGPDAHGGAFSLSFTGKCEIQVVGLASGAFFAADNTQGFERNAYFGSETVTWSLVRPAAGARFAYIIPPFQPLRPVLAPIAALSTLGTALVALLLVLVSTVLAGLVKPALFDYVRNRVRGRHAESKPRAKVKKWRHRRNPP